MSKEVFTYQNGEQLFFSVLAEQMQMSFRVFKRSFDAYCSVVGEYALSELLCQWADHVVSFGIPAQTIETPVFWASFSHALAAAKEQQGLV